MVMMDFIIGKIFKGNDKSNIIICKSQKISPKNLFLAF
jgi:hypothetical protein